MFESLLLTAVLQLADLKQDPPPLTRPYGHSQMHGYRKSAYRGKYYTPRLEGLRKRIMFRESRYTYGADNRPVSSAAGAYQFLQNSWGHSLPWMLHKENKKLFGVRTANKIKKRLQSKPIYRWNRYWQDAAFFTVINYNGTCSGAKHWYPLPGSC